MVDNGNLTRTGVAVSEKFMQTLQLGYNSVGKGIVPTARKGQGMTNLGISEEFTLRLNGLMKAYNVKALVCRELNDDINVGTSFLQKISEKRMGDGPWNAPMLTFYQDGVTLTTTEKQEIPLVQTMKETAGCRASGVAHPDLANPKEKEDSSKELESSSKELESSSKEPEDVSKKPEVSTGHQPQTSTCTERSARGRRTASIGGRVSIHSFPVFAKEDTVLKGGTLHFVKVKAAIPATALIESVTLRDEHVKAVPAIYQQIDRIVVINLEKQVSLIKRGEQIALVIPMK